MLTAAVKTAKARVRRVTRVRKSMWVREWLLKRHKYGMYEKLMKHLKEGDVKSFRNFVRIGPEMFNQLVEDLTPRLQKKTTNCRRPLSPALRLAARYLATGDSYKSLAYGFRVAANIIVLVVPEVCQATYDHYHETAFKCPTTAEEWKKVAHELSSLLWLHRWQE